MQTKFVNEKFNSFQTQNLLRFDPSLNSSKVTEITCSELMSTRKLVEQFSVIIWTRKFIEHRLKLSFEERRVNKAVSII